MLKRATADISALKQNTAAPDACLQDGEAATYATNSSKVILKKVAC